MLWLMKKEFFDHSIKNDMKTYHNTQKITTGQVDDYTAGGLQNCYYFKNHYSMISINSSKQQVLDANLKSIQQSNFT